MSKIVLEDFNEGNGYYKINLAYLNKEQVEEIEALVSKWNPTDEDIKSCIGMCLTDVSEQRFKDYGTNLKDCLAWLEKQVSPQMVADAYLRGCNDTEKKWLEKQGEQKPVDKVEPKFKVKYAGREYNVLEVIDVAGVTFCGIEDEPNHIDYVKAENCKIIGSYTIKENGSPYPTKPAMFSEQKPAWSTRDEMMLDNCLHFLKLQMNHHASTCEIECCIDWLKSLKQRMEE